MSDTDYIDMNAIFDDIECMALTTENAFVRRKFLIELQIWLDARAKA